VAGNSRQNILNQALHAAVMMFSWLHTRFANTACARLFIRAALANSIEVKILEI
jgi:hypothetical protein